MQCFEEKFGLTLKDKQTALPLKDVSVEAEIQGYVLGLKSTLKYTNDSSDPAEVVFRFPLEQSHAVIGLTAIIDGRKIKAQIKEKEEARADYDDALASGQSAALAEEKSGDVFSISLGNLPPGKEAEIHLQLVGELGIDAEGSVRFSLPSTLKPRYTPAGSSDPLVGVGGGAQAQVEQANTSCVQHFQLTVLNAQGVAEVTSPTHTITTTRHNDENKIDVILAASEPGDLVILIKHRQPHAPTALIENGSSEKEGIMKDPAVMINFFPEFDNTDAACEFIFLVDRSGSMSGGFINSARETLILFLKSLPEGCNFNIIGFGSSYEKLFPAVSVPYSQETLDKATRHAQGMQANLGGTELLQPLEYIFREKTTSGLPRQIFVLTDGAVSNTDACVRKVKENAARSRCFTFGIGSGASTALVEGLARAGNGTAEFVKHGERLQPKVIRSLKKALQPAVTDVNVEFKLPSSHVVQQSPQNLPPIYNGEKMVVYGVITTKGSQRDQEVTGKAVLKGHILGKKIEHSVPFTFNPVNASSPSLPTIHHLGAKALIKDWQDQDENKEEIVKLSVESSVISSHTAFIAVDEESSEPVASAMKTWDIQASSIQLLQEQVAAVSMAMASNIDHLLVRGDRLDDLSENAECLNVSSAVFHKKAKKKSGFSFGSLFSGLSNRLYGSKSESSQSVLKSPPSAVLVEGTLASVDSDSDNDKDLDIDDLEEELECMYEEDSQSNLEVARILKSAAAPIPSSTIPPHSATTPMPGDTLSSIIAAQQADGSWKFNSTLTKLVLKSQKIIEDTCPVECEGVVAAVWATVLILTLLRKKYSSQQDEWELIAMKAESWMKKQALPTGVTIQDLYTAAEAMF